MQRKRYNFIYHTHLTEGTEGKETRRKGEIEICSITYFSREFIKTKQVMRRFWHIK